MTEADSALLISLIGFFNTGGRIVSGLITDHPRVDALFLTTVTIFLGNIFTIISNVLITILIAGAICPLLMTFCYNFWSYVVVCVMFGLFLSAWPAVTSSCLVRSS